MNLQVAEFSTLTSPHHDLVAEQHRTLATPRMPAGIGARALFGAMDLVYGRAGSLAKFRVLEVIARVPYIAWEQVSYVAITHTHSTPAFARDIHQEVQRCRQQQDNELYHLLILEELLQGKGERQGFWRYRLIPQVLAWFYYHLSWLLFVVNPEWSHALNAQFEDHAEHEYMEFVDRHEQVEAEPWVSDFKRDYGNYETVADLLRQIALDERHHKEESLARIGNARFGGTRRDQT